MVSAKWLFQGSSVTVSEAVIAFTPNEYTQRNTKGFGIFQLQHISLQARLGDLVQSESWRMKLYSQLPTIFKNRAFLPTAMDITGVSSAGALTPFSG